MGLRPILGVVFLFASLGFLLISSVPGLVSDLQHQSEFQPAEGARITDANCTNWNYAMLHQCTLKLKRAANAPEEELSEWAFGRAAEGRVQLLATPGEPTVFTTDVAMSEINGRIIFAAVVIGGLVLFTVGLVARIGKLRHAPAG